MSDTNENVVDVVVCRHPQKDGDKITPLGAMQAWACALALHALGFVFGFFGYSGANRTKQAVKVMATALGVDMKISGDFALDEGFHFQSTWGPYYPSETGGKDRYLAELKALQEATDGTLADALAEEGDLGKFTRAGREVFTETLGTFAVALAATGIKQALMLSHSPWTELAVLDPSSVPYGLGEADAIHYQIRVNGRDGEIVSSRLIKAPMEGRGTY